MHARADLAVYDSHGRLIAIAEVKNKLGTSTDWAAKTRRNMFAHGGFGNADFFLIVTPDKIYLWKDVGADPDPVPPTYVADTEPELGHYFQGIGTRPERISNHAFELMVSAWFANVIRSFAATSDDSCAPKWLAQSGLMTAIKNGRVEHEAIV